MRINLRVALVVGVGGGASTLSEIVWVRHLERILGATSLSQAAAAGAFFIAMALGAWGAARRIDRGGDGRRMLVLLQLVGAFWATASTWSAPIITAASDAVAALGSSAGLLVMHYAVAGVALLVPGLTAGALVPLVAALRPEAARPGRDVAGLWVWDAVGGAIGAAGTGALLLPRAGATACLWLESALHVLVALVAAGLGGSMVETEERRRASGPVGGARRHESRPSRPAVGPRVLLMILGVCGAGGVGWQTLWSRMLVLSLPGGLSWPAILVASWIGGTALGAFFYRRSASARSAPGLTLGLATLGAAAGGWLGVAAGAWGREVVVAARPLSPLLGEWSLAISVSLVAAISSGLALPAGVDLLRPARRGVGGATGHVLAADVVGAAAATVLVPLVLVPAVGLGRSVLIFGGVQVAAGSLLLAQIGAWGSRGPGRIVALSALATAAAGAFAAAADLEPYEASLGGDESAEVEPIRVVWGPAAAAAVVANADGQRRLFVDRHHGMGGEVGVFIERRQGHLPLVLHGAAKTAAVTGVGTGDTLGAIARHDLRHVDAAESLASVLRMIDLFGRTNEQIWRHEEVEIHHVDGHAMLRRSRRRYDVVVADLVHPWRAGASGLYALEHLEVVRDRLAPGGLFCLWLPLHELSTEDLSIVAATFGTVFDDGTALLGHLGWRQPILAFVGGGPPAAELLDRARLAAAIGDPPPRWARETDLDAPEDLQSLYIGDAGWLSELAAGAPITTWDRPVLARRSSETWWRGTEGLGERTLGALLARRRPVAEILPDDEAAIRRHDAVGVLLEAELAEAAGDLEAAARGYREAAGLDPSFGLPRLALEMLRRRR